MDRDEIIDREICDGCANEFKLSDEFLKQLLLAILPSEFNRPPLPLIYFH
jgi:hypothetical protein